MKIAQIQMPASDYKMKSVARTKQIIDEKVPKDVDLITLPEMFCCPYDIKKFAVYAEKESGQVWQACSDIAKERQCYLSAGSIPEVDDEGNIYNTAYVFDREGKQIAKHRKVHLFDISIKEGQRFRESEVITAGNKITTFETEFGTMGICVCFDVRFPELFRVMALKGARIILVPASFNMTTGPAHWELLFRSQAVNNQVFVVGTAASRDDGSSYRSWGHSIVVDPWARVLSQLGEEPGVAITDIDLAQADTVREQLPLLKHRRTDLYGICNEH